MRGARHRLGEHGLQRTLSELAYEQSQQKVLLVGGGARQQVTSRRARSLGEPRPVVVAICSKTLSTSINESTGVEAAASGFDSRIAEPPIPIRPWRGSPDRNATAMSTSGSVTRRSSAARSAILTRRPLAFATASLVVTSS